MLAVVTFLAVGLIYPPLASEHLEESLGPFGSGYGTSTVVSIAVACLGFGVVGGALLRADPQRGVVDAAGRRARGRPGGG